MKPLRLCRSDGEPGLWECGRGDKAEYEAYPPGHVDALRSALLAAEARAEKAERERDEARGLLREAKDLDYLPVCRGPRTDGPCDCLTARIDTHLERK